MNYTFTPPVDAECDRTELLQGVLSEWLSEALDNSEYRRINICHFCAGSGQDAETVLNIVRNLEPAIRKRSVRIEVLFNEYNKSDFQNLKTRVKAATLAYPFPRKTVATFVRNEEALAIAKKNAWHMKEDLNFFLFGEMAFHKRFHSFFHQIEEFEATDIGFFFSPRFARQVAAKKKIDRQGLPPSTVCARGYQEILKQFLSLFPPEGPKKIYHRSFQHESDACELVVASHHLPMAESLDFQLAEDLWPVAQSEGLVGPYWNTEPRVPRLFPATSDSSLPRH